VVWSHSADSSVVGALAVGVPAVGAPAVGAPAVDDDVSVQMVFNLVVLFAYRMFAMMLSLLCAPERGVESAMRCAVCASI